MSVLCLQIGVVLCSQCTLLNVHSRYLLFPTAFEVKSNFKNNLAFFE